MSVLHSAALHIALLLLQLHFSGDALLGVLLDDRVLRLPDQNHVLVLKVAFEQRLLTSVQLLGLVLVTARHLDRIARTLSRLLLDHYIALGFQALLLVNQSLILEYLLRLHLVRLRLALIRGMLGSDIRTDNATRVTGKLLLVVVLEVHVLLLAVLIVHHGTCLVHGRNALSLRRGRAQRLLAHRLIVETLLLRYLLHALVLVAGLEHLHVVISRRRWVDVQRAKFVRTDTDDSRLVFAVRRLHKILLLLIQFLGHVEALLLRVIGEVVRDERLVQVLAALLVVVVGHLHPIQMNILAILLRQPELLMILLQLLVALTVLMLGSHHGLILAMLYGQLLAVALHIRLVA